MYSSEKLCLHVVSFALHVFEAALLINVKFSLVQKEKDFNKFNKLVSVGIKFVPYQTEIYQYILII